MPTNYAVMHEAYTVQMHLLVIAKRMQPRVQFIEYKVVSEVTNLQVESTVWTYYVHIFPYHCVPSL